MPGCRKEKIETNESPICVKKRIVCQEYRNQISALDNYISQSQSVFTIVTSSIIVHGTSEHIDENCRTLGYPVGLKGNTMIMGELFSKAIFVNNIWEKQLSLPHFNPPE